MQACDAVGVDAAQVRGSEDFSGLGRILFRNAEMEKRAIAEIAQRFDGEKFGLHFGHVFSALGNSTTAGLARGFQNQKE